MALIYSTKLVSLRNFSGTRTFFVPAGLLWIVRDANFYFGSNGVASATVADENGAVFIYAPLGDPITASWYGWNGRTVIPAGGQLTVQTSVGLDVTVSGYALTTP